MLTSIPCTIMRGGTSKGIFFRVSDIPGPGPERDGILLRVMGSPDLRQIDGLGGSVSTTSKAAIIGASSRPDADVDYTFAQVSIDKALVDYKGNCGNISSAVGPYAIEVGLVRATEAETVVRVYNTNTRKVIHSHVATCGGKVVYDGDFSISGVPGTASRIKLAFRNPAGAVTGRLLPTGAVSDLIEVEGIGSLEVSIVDVTNPLVFVRARDLGLSGRELPDEIDSRPEILARLEAVRGTAAVLLGFATEWRKASTESPAVPKMTIVSEPAGYVRTDGGAMEADDIDLAGRMMSMQKTHKTYALTGALCTAAAAVIPGTIVNRIARPGFDPGDIRIGHPGGSIRAGVLMEDGAEIDGNTVPEIVEAFGFRTARLIMSGTAFYRQDVPIGQGGSA